MATQLPDGTLVENWTTHPVRFMDLEADVSLCIQPEVEGPARMDMSMEPIEGSQYIMVTNWGQALRLPPSREEGDRPVYFIVSSVVKTACPDRFDLVVPSKTIRNAQGKVFACSSFSV